MPRPRSRGRALCSSLLVLCTLIAPLQPLRAAEPTSPILIGEVQWSGSSRSTADEWLELWNIGTEPVDLLGWSLVGASEKPIVFVSSTLLAPQQTFLVANYPANSDKTLLSAQTIALATSSLALSNDHLQIELRNPQGNLQDSAGTGARPPAGASTPINTSMIRVRTSTGWNWTSPTTTFSLSAADLGTPGICDSCALVSSTPVQPSPTNPPSDPVIEPSESTDLIEEEAPEAFPVEPVTPLLEPEEAALYGVTEADLIAEQPTSSAPFPYESPALGTSSSTLPTLQETASSSSSIFVTSTDETVTNEPATSTPVLAPTSTVVVTSTVEQATTTQVITEIPSSPVPSSVNAPSVLSPPQDPIALPPDLSSFDPVITEFIAAPTTGQEEWIELKLPDNASPLRYIDWKIEADGKTIYTFTAAVIQALSSQGGYLLPAWKTAKLKNTGATLRLKRADGTVAQEIRYGTSLKNTSWIRDEVSGSWKITRHPTKGLTNIFEAIAVAVAIPKPVKPTSTAKTPITKSATSTTRSIAAQKKAITAKPPASSGGIKTIGAAATAGLVKSQDKTVSKTATKKTATPKKTKAPAAPKATKKTTIKKASTKKPVVTPTTVTHFEQIPPEQLSPRVRVRLQGVVGSTAGVFGKQRFVLLAPDGRGLLVKTTTQQPSPGLGDTIEITGLLFANDEGVQLQMEASDTWKSYSLPATTTPRVIEWTSPGIEDQWSFTRLEGTVTDSRASSITVEAQIGEVTIPIKAILGYRAQRVKMGDTIEVSGIFDGRSGTWKIQPSKSSDIVIVRHPEQAAQAATTSPSSTKLPWNAIGIAIGSIGAIEGIRRWLEKRKTGQLIPKHPIPATS